MSITVLLSDPEWDAPFYKILAPNDTGEAVGHQAGIVIPKALRDYFPRLSDSGSYLEPTNDHYIAADLFLGTKFLGSVRTRYQYQTWGGTRPAESRLTDQLTQLRDRARGGDIAIFQRRLDDLEHFRIVLVRASSPDAAEIKNKLGPSRWGILGRVTPVTTADFQKASAEETAKELLPFSLFQPDAATTMATTLKVARSIIFKSRVNSLYLNSCSVCGSGIRSPRGLREVEAAHIVPRSRFGADDPRNGLCLCRTHHWCFDKGLFGINDDRRIIVPKSVSQMGPNTALSSLRGQPIREASEPSMMASPQALEWHRKNVLLDQAA